MIQTAIDGQGWGTSVEATAWCHEAEGNLRGAGTILLVEDEKFVREVTAEVLRSAGYQVLSARDASEALRAREAHGAALDLLLTDVILPGETGRALATRLRGEIPELKVLLISGYAEQMQVPGMGTEECLAKPFSAGVLLRTVRQVLSNGEAVACEKDWIKHARDNELLRESGPEFGTVERCD